jgi:MFS family permease
VTTTTAATPSRSLWHDRRFRTFWIGETLSQFGDRISELALPLIAVVLLDASPTQVGLLTAAVWGPNLVSLFVGSWVDQQPRKRVLLVVADLSRAAVLATVPLAYALDALTLVHLYVVALLAGLGQVLFSTAYPPFFVALVPRDRFLDANSKLSASRSASFIAGPAVGGALVQALTAPVAILVDALTFVASAFQIGRVRVEEAPVENPHGHSLLRRAREGLVYVLRHPFLRYSLGCATTINFFTLMASALLVLYASRTLGLSAGLIGLALGIGALGGLVGAVSAPVLAARFGVGPVIVAGAILFPAPLALLALAGGPEWSAALVLGAVEFVSALGVMLFDVNLNALQASVTPDAVRSRVSGAFSTINYGIRPLGAVVGGVLGTQIGLRPTLVVAALGGTLSALWLLPSPIPRVHSLDGLEPPQDAGRFASPAADTL